MALGDLLVPDPVIIEAKERYTQTEAYQARLIAKYRKYHHWYAPANDDQWPEDQAERPGKIHITNNVIKPVVDIEARLQAIEPRIVLLPNNPADSTERARAELVERMMMVYMDQAKWKSQAHSLCRVKGIYGKGVVKVFWNAQENRPDFTVVENPAHLRIGWGASDFSVIDWTIFEYSLSPMEVMRRWPDIGVIPTPGREPLMLVHKSAGSHDDPLAQRVPDRDVIPHYQPSDYERKQVQVWDYWYRDIPTDQVMNCIILERAVHAIEPTPHPELPDIPYIVIENDHEPGSPEGQSSIAPLIDLQIELNRVLSHWAQLIVDETDPAWQIDADYIPAGMVPKAGEISPAGEGHQIQEIPKQINVFPIDQYHSASWFNIERLSGLPQVAFGQTQGSTISGRALAVQIEATANRLDHKRQMLYDGYVQILKFWSFMVQKVDPKVKEGEKSTGIGIVFKDLTQWKIIAPEITPRHIIEHTMNTINKVTNGLMSARTAMDELGIDSPEDELRQVKEERSDLALNPGHVMQQLSAMAAAQQMQINQQQMQMQSALGAANDPSGENAVLQARQEGEPQRPEDMNEQGMAPSSAPGSPAPGRFAQTTLVRTNPQGQPQTLNQVSFNRPL